MDPLLGAVIVGGAAQGVAAIINYYNAEKARKADKEKLDEIRKLYDQIKPPDYDLKIDAPPKLHTEKLALPQFREAHFDTTKLKPEQLKLVGQLSPTLAPYIAEAAPQLVQKSADAQAGRQAQLQALQRYMAASKPGGVDPALAQAQEMARQKAQIEAQSREQSIAQDWNRRGLMGSGLGMAQQMQSGASAMDRMALQNMEAAKQAYQARLQNLASGAALGGEIGREDNQQAAQNAAIINAFNQRLAAGRQGWEQDRASALTGADKFNLGLAQDVANKNWATTNDFLLNQQARNDALEKFVLGRDDTNAKWGYGAQFDERDYLNKMLTQQAAWVDRERQQKNATLSNAYQDMLQKLAGQSGALQGQAAGARQAAQDQASAVQGLGNVVGSAAGGYGQYEYNTQQANRETQRINEDQASRAKAANFEKTGNWELPAGYYGEDNQKKKKPEVDEAE
jgi:hypothetical protein